MLLLFDLFAANRSSRSEVFLGKSVPKICSKLRAEHPCRSVVSKKFQSTLWYGCWTVNLLHMFGIPFPKNTSGRLLLSKDLL